MIVLHFVAIYISMTGGYSKMILISEYPQIDGDSQDELDCAVERK